LGARCAERVGRGLREVMGVSYQRIAATTITGERPV
jgi:hypothetical protein